MSIWKAIAYTFVVRFALVFALALAGGLQLGFAGTSFVDAISTASASPMNLGFAQLLAFLLIVALARSAGPPVSASFRSPMLLTAGALVLGLSMQIVLAEVANIVNEIAPADEVSQATLHRWLNSDNWTLRAEVFFAFVIVAPITEELIFRGIIFEGLRDRYGNASAIVSSALLFGAIHGGTASVVYATLGGIVLALLVLWTRSIVLSIGMHVGFNAVPVLLPSSLIEITGLNTLSTHVEHIDMGYVVAATMVSVFLLWWFRKRRVDEEQH